MEQLSRLCSSDELKLKYKLCELLKYLVNETISGRGEQLKNYSIGVDVFYRAKDFEPELDPIVRIEVGRLRNSLNKYYLNQGEYDPIRIVIPKGKYVPAFISQEDSQSQFSEKPEGTEQTILSLTKGPSIAVLPFKNLTGDPEQEYFAHGLTEELLSELFLYEDFRIIGYRSAYKKNNNNHNEKKLLHIFGARYIIEGSVRKDNLKFKVSIKLIDTVTGEQLWCEQFKRVITPENLISIQEEIARQAILMIANEYGIILQKINRASRKKTPKELETYEAILRYYYYSTQQTPKTALAAFNALEQAVVKEPKSGIALALLASLYGNRYLLDLSNDIGLKDKMVELVKKAIEFEPNNQMVRIVNAWSYFVLEKRDHFLVEIDNALFLKPKSPFKIGAIGFFLSLYGEWDRGKALLDKAMSQSIGFPGWFYGATSLYFYRLNEFEKAYDQALRYNVPGIFWGPMLRTAILGQLGRTSDAEKDLSDLNTLKPEFEKKARYLISRYVKEEELVEHFIYGLQKAGLGINHKYKHRTNLKIVKTS